MDLEKTRTCCETAHGTLTWPSLLSRLLGISQLEESLFQCNFMYTYSALGSHGRASHGVCHLQARFALMIAGKATIKRKRPEAATMSRWGQTKYFPRFPKSALHEFHQVLLPTEFACMRLDLHSCRTCHDIS